MIRFFTKHSASRYILAMVVILVSGCEKEDEKQPTAAFITDKDSYTAGETIQLINTSISADSFEWTLPDGETLTSSNASFKTDETLDYTEGTRKLAFKLEAFSKNKTKTDSWTQQIEVSVAWGRALFYTSGAERSVNVTIPGQQGGPPSFIVSNTNHIPTCADGPGYPLPVGTFTASYEKKFVVFNIMANQCTAVDLP